MIKCKICNKEFKNNLGGQLTNHLKNIHNLSYEDYCILTKLNGIEPKCKCGYCDTRPNFRRGKFSSFAIGHEKHEWRKKMYLKKFGQPKCHNDECYNIVNFYRGEPRKYCSHNCQESNWNQDKVRNTVKQNYGAENVFQLKEIKKKSRQTCIKKYGVEYPQSLPEIKERVINSNMEKYGVEHPQKLDFVKEKQKKTLIKNYGVSHFSKTDAFREIASKNMCKYNSNVNDNHKIKKYKDTELYYQSQYEYRFLQNCEKLNILEEVDNSPTFKYLDKKHGNWHLPDFKFREKYIIEIKSTYWMKRQGGMDTINIKKESVEAKDYQYIFCLDENYDEFNRIL